MIPMPLPSHSRARLGFTLIELSVVLVIISLLTSAGLTLGMAMIERERVTQTNRKLDAIEEALLSYRKSISRLPCPADITQAITAANFGVEAATPGTCWGGSPAANFRDSVPVVVGGMIPVRSLQLPDDYGFDGWGRRIFYEVTTAYTGANYFTATSAVTDVTNAKVQVYSADPTVAANEKTNVTIGRGVYGLVSFGKNGYGAWRRNVSSITDRNFNSSMTALEGYNCNCSTTAANGSWDLKLVQANSNPTSANTYDDIVRYKVRSQLRSASE